MADYGSFAHGAVNYPLTTATTNSLLQDADPAIYHALEFFSGMLDIHLGARLFAEAANLNLTIPNAVALKLAMEPQPFLLANQFRFPLLALYRKSETSTDHTAVWSRDDSEWELAYVLPPLIQVHAEKLTPILRAASRIIAHCCQQGYDPAYLSGQNIWDTANLQKVSLVSTQYGGYDPIENIDKYYRAIVCKLIVKERDDYPTTGTPFETFNGADIAEDFKALDNTKITDFVLAKTLPAPTVTQISPATGTKAGGTSVTITGTGFVVGNRVSVKIGGAACTSVVVASTTSITCVTPAHDAYPTFVADVVVTNLDGQAGTLSSGFTFT